MLENMLDSFILQLKSPIPKNAKCISVGESISRHSHAINLEKLDHLFICRIYHLLESSRSCISCYFYFFQLAIFSIF